MSQLTESFFQKILDMESGFQDEAEDTGNYICSRLAGTNMGITPISYSEWKGIDCPSKEDIKNLSESDGRAFYRWYWRRWRLDELDNQLFAELVANATILGPSGGFKTLQRTLNKHFGYSLTVDGDMGTGTIAAANSVSNTQFVKFYNLYRDAYTDFLASLNNGTYNAGWQNRMNNHFPPMEELPFCTPLDSEDLIPNFKGVYVEDGLNWCPHDTQPQAPQPTGKDRAYWWSYVRSTVKGAMKGRLKDVGIFIGALILLAFGGRWIYKRFRQ